MNISIAESHCNRIMSGTFILMRFNTLKAVEKYIDVIAKQIMSSHANKRLKLSRMRINIDSHTHVKYSSEVTFIVSGYGIKTHMIDGNVYQHQNMILATFSRKSVVAQSCIHPGTFVNMWVLHQVDERPIVSICFSKHSACMKRSAKTTIMLPTIPSKETDASLKRHKAQNEFQNITPQVALRHATCKLTKDELTKDESVSSTLKSTDVVSTDVVSTDVVSTDVVSTDVVSTDVMMSTNIIILDSKLPQVGAITSSVPTVSDASNYDIFGRPRTPNISIDSKMRADILEFADNEAVTMLCALKHGKADITQVNVDNSVQKTTLSQSNEDPTEDE